MEPFYKKVNDELELRELVTQDVEAYYTILDQNRTELARWEPAVARLSIENIREFIDPMFKEGRNLPLNLGIWYRGRLSGLMQFRHEYHAEPCIGYWLIEELWNRGIVTAAARALLEVLFIEWDWERITIDCEETNLPSRRIAEKLGFQLERIIPAEEWGGKEGPGQCLYAISRVEWQSLSQEQAGQPAGESPGEEDGDRM